METSRIVIVDDEVRYSVSSGKRGRLLSRTVLFNCPCGKQRVIPKRKLDHYKSELCRDCSNKLTKTQFAEAMAKYPVQGKFKNIVCKVIDGVYTNVTL